MRKIFASLAVASFVFAAGVGAAQADGPNPVKYRQGVFQAVAWNFGPLVGMVKGKMDFNADMVKANAENLVALGKMMPVVSWQKAQIKAKKPARKRRSGKIWMALKPPIKNMLMRLPTSQQPGLKAKKALAKLSLNLAQAAKPAIKTIKKIKIILI